MTYASDSAGPILARLIEALPDPAALIDPHTGSILLCNHHATQLHAAVGNDLRSSDAASLRVEQEREPFRRRCLGILEAKQATDNPTSVSFEETLLTVDGPVRARTQASLIEHDDKLHLLTIWRAMPDSDPSEGLAAVLVQLPEPVIMVQPRAPHALLINAHAAALLGLASPGSYPVESRSWRLYADGRELSSSELPTSVALRTGVRCGPQDCSLVLEGAVQSRDISITATPLFDPAGRLVMAVASIRDLDEVRRLRRDLRRAHAQAELDARRKGTFYASLSRELRGPLTSILGYIDLIAEQESPMGERHEWCTLVRKSGEALMGVIRDLVDLGHMESESFDLDRTPFSLGLVVAEVLSQMRTRAQRHGFDVVARYTTAVPRTLRWDAARVRQVLTTILSYSIDHATRGDVTLQIAVIGTGPDRKLAFDTACVSRSATAPELEALFDPIPPSVGPRSSNLGFAVAKRLARMMDGQLEGRVEDHRLCFRFIVTPAAADFDQSAPPSPVALQTSSAEAVPGALRGRVLLVQGGAADHDLVAVLEKAGLKVETVTSDRAALQAQLDRYVAVLMDVQVPGEGGLPMARRLRDSGATLPIIALSASLLPDNRERCLQAGCTAYLSTPIDPTTLLRTLDGLITTTEDRRVLSELPKELQAVEPLRSSREDDPVVRDILPQFGIRVTRYVDQLARMIHDGDRSGTQRAARALSGTANNYGFESLATSSRVLADACADEQASVDDLHALYSKLVDLAQRIRAAYPARSSTIPPPSR